MKNDVVVKRVESWLYSTELAALLSAFAGPGRSGSSIVDYVHELALFSSVWDFRKGKERTDIERQNFSAEQLAAIEQAARALGMIGYKKPRLAEYDQVIILGGTLLSCYLRVNFARALLLGGLAVRKIYALGTRRVPSESEWLSLKTVTGEDFSAASDEFEMLCAVVRKSEMALVEKRACFPAEEDRKSVV